MGNPSESSKDRFLPKRPLSLLRFALHRFNLYGTLIAWVWVWCTQTHNCARTQWWNKREGRGGEGSRCISRKALLMSGRPFLFYFITRILYSFSEELAAPDFSFPSGFPSRQLPKPNLSLSHFHASSIIASACEGMQKRCFLFSQRGLHVRWNHPIIFSFCEAL